jgi:multiple sugar transport system substrate-binding protein
MTRTTRRFPIWLTVFAIAALVLGACQAAGESPPPEAPATDGAPPAEATPAPEEDAGEATPIGTPLTGQDCPEDQRVTFWTSHGPPDVETLREIAEAFNEQSDTACVTLIQVPGAETDVSRLMTAVRGGTGPDVYMLDRFTAAQRAAEGVLTELPQAAELQDQYLEFAWAEASFQGTAYALPFDTDTRALYYRPDILEEAGVSQEQIDSLDPANGPITIEELRAIADQVDTEEGGAYDRVGFIPWINQGWHYTWGFTFGGEFADLEACTVTPTNEGVVAGFQFMYDWAEAKDPQKLATWTSSFLPPDLPPAQDPFITGQLAMVITGDWVISQMEQYAPDVDYGITWIPVPEEGDDTQTWAGGWSATIPNGAQNPDGGWEFMQFFAGEEGQRMYVEGTNHLPTLQSLVDDESIFSERHLHFRETLEFAKSRPPLPVGALYWDSLTTAQDAVTRNTEEPEAALQAVEEEVQPQLEQFCPLTGG